MKVIDGEMYGISRIDSETYHTHAWRVSLRRRGKMLVKNFPDKKHGSKTEALVFAKAHRDEMLAKYPPITRKEFSSALRSNNNTGITGVYKYSKKYSLANGNEAESWYWEAHWPTERGESSSERFSVNEYGEDMARGMAIRAREKGMKGVEGLFWASERGELAAAPTAVADNKRTRRAEQPAARSRKTVNGFDPRAWMTPFWLGKPFGKSLENNG